MAMTMAEVSSATEWAWTGPAHRLPRRRRAPPRVTGPREGPRGRHRPRRAAHRQPRRSCRPAVRARGIIIDGLPPFFSLSARGGGEGAEPRRESATLDPARRRAGSTRDTRPRLRSRLAPSLLRRRLPRTALGPVVRPRAENSRRPKGTFSRVCSAEKNYFRRVGISGPRSAPLTKCPVASASAFVVWTDTK